MKTSNTRLIITGTASIVIAFTAGHIRASEAMAALDYPYPSSPSQYSRSSNSRTTSTGSFRQAVPTNSYTQPRSAAVNIGDRRYSYSGSGYYPSRSTTSSYSSRPTTSGYYPSRSTTSSYSSRPTTSGYYPTRSTTSSYSSRPTTSGYYPSRSTTSTTNLTRARR